MDTFLGGANMCEAQIYIKNIKKQNKLHLASGVSSLYPPEGGGVVKISLVQYDPSAWVQKERGGGVGEEKVYTTSHEFKQEANIFVRECGIKHRQYVRRP